MPSFFCFFNNGQNISIHIIRTENIGDIGWILYLFRDPAYILHMLEVHLSSRDLATKVGIVESSLTVIGLEVDEIVEILWEKRPAWINIIFKRLSTCATETDIILNAGNVKVK